jgi:hypothetical protein
MDVLSDVLRVIRLNGALLRPAVRNWPRYCRHQANTWQSAT